LGRKTCIPFSSWCIDPLACFKNQNYMNMCSLL
jgi:hypothetical protein